MEDECLSDSMLKLILEKRILSSNKLLVKFMNTKKEMQLAETHLNRCVKCNSIICNAERNIREKLAQC